ncbi:hypothetical protein GCM10011391_27190 [Pullulanibacillus camelliae]|uniref:Uncharacterized protein n=1 Tax=Pullulanibacillus camelliae TaxID=1707096 RepID=A0A8J2YJJ6_9BACL|nr:hypothetical protein GCM10011391_27190 [Pullulanibacillus camelliae]
MLGKHKSSLILFEGVLNKANNASAIFAGVSHVLSHFLQKNHKFCDEFNYI